MKTKLRKTLLVVLITVVLFELTLQALAFAVWIVTQPDPVEVTAETVVLCVGDSFTYGAGATRAEASYPAQLEALCRQKFGDDWQVVNGGRGSQNSRDVLARLDAQLAECRPKYVCAVLGCNDRWGRPAELRLPDTAQAAPTGFRWELRTLRLLRTFRGYAPAADEAPADTASMGQLPALIGTWRATDSGLVAVFAADGTCQMQGGLHQWRSDGTRLELDGPTLRIAFGLERRGKAWTLTPDPSPETVITLVPAESVLAPKTSPLARGEMALFQKQWDVAAAQFVAGRKRAAVGSDDWLDCTIGLARAEVGRGTAAALADLAAEIEAIHQVSPSASSWLARVQLAKVGRDNTTIRRLARQAIDAGQEDMQLWQSFIMASYWLEDVETMRPIFEQALLRFKSAPDREWIWPLLASVASRQQDGGLGKVLVRTFSDNGSIAILDRLMAVHMSKLDQAQLEAACLELDLRAVERDAVVSAWRRCTRPLETASVLESHLAQLVARVRRAGAEPIFGTYPFSASGVETAMHNVSTRLGVRVARITDRFVRAKQEDPDCVLTVADGHCNDAGYGLMAAEMLAEIQGSRDGPR